MKLLISFKDFMKFCFKLEKETSLGQYNLLTAKITFLTYLLSLFSGTLIFKYKPLEGVNFLKGFELEFGSQGSNWMIVILILNLPICIVLLVYCFKIGLVDSKFRLVKQKEDKK